MAGNESAPRYKINTRRPRTGEISDDQIGAMAHALNQTDPHGEIHLLHVRNRRRKKGEPEEEFTSEVIKEITFGKDSYDIEGVSRMRLVVDTFYVRIQIGRIFKDSKGKFSVDREMALDHEEFPQALELLKLAEETSPQLRHT